MKICSDVKQNASAKAIISNVTGRAGVKKIHSVLNANCISAAADGRAMLAPTIRVFFFYAAVGAAIGRPPVKIHSGVKQHASAVKISTISPVGIPQ